MNRRGFLQSLALSAAGIYIPKEVLSTTFISIPKFPIIKVCGHGRSPCMVCVLKELYCDDNTIKDLVWQKNPFLDMINKTDGFNGKYFPNPLKYT